MQNTFNLQLFESIIAEDNSLKSGKFITFLLYCYDLSYDNHILIDKIKKIKETDKKIQNRMVILPRDEGTYLERGR